MRNQTALRRRRTRMGMSQSPGGGLADDPLGVEGKDSRRWYYCYYYYYYYDLYP